MTRMLTLDGCRRRQERLRELLAREDLDAALISDSRDVYYLSGFLPSGPPSFPVLLYLETNGRTVMTAYTAEGDAAVDERVTYEPHLLFTLNPDLTRRLARATVDHLAGTR